MRIPEELKAHPRWVCCTDNKLPLDPKTGKAAASTDPATWASYATAAAAVAPLGCRGIGFVLGDGVAGIDIDHCIDPATGAVDARALDIVAAMQSYTEISPSGTGLHILFCGRKPGPACRRALGGGLGLEMYDSGRYFTITGRSWHDPPLPLADRTAEAAEIYRQYLDKPKPAAPTAAQATPVQPRPAGAPSDAEILEKAKQAKGGDKLAALLAGDWQAYAASHSEADLALCNLLAFWLGADKARMDAAFRASGLFRPKWDQRRGADTYGNITLARALAECQEVYDPTPAPPQVPAEEAKAEVADLLRSMGITPSKKPEQAPVPAAPAPGRKTYSLDDTGNARRFRDQYGDKVRYNYTQGCWMIWTGQVWRRDETAAVKQMCDAMLDGMEKGLFGIHDPQQAAALRKFIQKSRGSHAKDNLLKEAQHLTGIPAIDNDFDKARGVLNVQNGVLKLRSGKLHPHDRARLITRLAGAAYDPDAQAPTWLRFLDDVTGGDKALQTYLQCMVGYMLTGSTREQCIFFLYGDGSNGKSTFLEILAELLGTYAMNAQSDTITARRSSDGPRTDIARLKGARLVTISECPADVWLDEAIVKQLTGGDVVTARYLYGREFEFRPEFKLIMATNHKPRIRGTDSGIWRRIRLVPFTQRIPDDKQDLQLPDKLRTELPGILNWALEGLRQWLTASAGGKRRGMPRCPAVDTATAEYRGEQDRLKQFLEDCTEPAPGYTIQAGILYQVYRRWCEENGERYPLTGNKFGREIAKALQRTKTRTNFAYQDVRLTDEGNRLMAYALQTGPRPRSGAPLYEQQRLDAVPRS
ncbi:phage/plasmid primase, P4 family [uncultured Subdoligranulum sp.]|uniref:phage/plasmid primase, P4 family n=1 Tax=uncultured Subdoligranulum sp. TaxID=512298 RepID=UPI0025DAF7BE|nr:phage/plasmid primase, P4 family [uncultured Subdoligranulum sp.]